MVGSRVRAQLAYRSSFVVDALTAFGIGVLEFSELYLLLATVPTLGGLTLIQVALVFALANMAFSLADLIFGQLDQINGYLREGKLEAFLVRPLPLMAQLVTADFQLRRARPDRFSRCSSGQLRSCTLDPVLDLRTVLPADHHPVRRRRHLWSAVRPGRRAAVLRSSTEPSSPTPSSMAARTPVRFRAARCSTDPGTVHLRHPRHRRRVPAGIVHLAVCPGQRSYRPGWAGSHRCSHSGSGCSLIVWRAGIRHFTGAGG